MPAPHVCIDRVLPRDLMRFQPTTERSPVAAISLRGKEWSTGSILKVRFVGGTDAQRKLVVEQAEWWTKHANLTFAWGDAPDADIRVGFDEGLGSWSYLGSDCSSIPREAVTMNLGFLDGGTAAHEFGHAIGLAHEHQNPAGGISWNEEEVIRQLAGAPNFWTAEQTRHNVLTKYAVNQINGTAFDPASVMLYWFPASWTTNNVSTTANETLSATDKAYVASAQMYPGRTMPAPDAVVLTVGARKRTQAAIGKAGESDSFKFVASAPGSYQIATSGAAVHMKLYGPNNPTALIAEDSNFSGYGNGARIRADIVSGVYFISIRHADQAAGVGSYAIGVERHRRVVIVGRKKAQK